MSTTESTAGQPIVFILDNVTDYQNTADGLNANFEVHILSADGDALAQMVALLDGRTGLDAIHLISHGDAGVLDLGTLSLSSANLGDHSAALAALGASLSPDGDFLLYGCDVAQGEAGVAFVDALAVATGADVAASNDTTGPAAQGGDAVLEYETGSIEAVTLDDSAFQSSLGADSALPAGLTTSPYVFNGADFQLRIDGSISNADLDHDLVSSMLTGINTDRFALSNIADGTVVSVYMGNSSTLDDRIQIIRGGFVLTQNDNSGDGDNSEDAYLSWTYQAGDIVHATTTGTLERGSYSLYVGTASGPAPIASILDNAPVVTVAQPVYAIVENGVGKGWTDSGGSLTGTLSLANGASLGDLSGLGFAVDGPSFSDDGGNLTAIGQFGNLNLNPQTGVYSYNPNVNTIDALGEGETGIDTFTFNATGVAGDVTSGSFSFSVTGSNDAPVISLDGQGATLVEASGADNAVAGKEVAQIGVLMSDAEGSVGLNTSALESDGWVLIPDTSFMSHEALYGSVQLDLTTGQVTYTLNNALEATQLLNSGDSVVESFHVSVIDGGGLTDRVAVSFEVHGADDGLVMAVDQAPPAATYIDGDGFIQTNYGRTGFLNVSDIDTLISSYDGLTFGLQGGVGDDGGNLSVAGQAGYLHLNTGTGKFDYVGNASIIEQLAEGASITEHFTFSVSDVNGVLDTGVYEVQFVGVHTEA
ncbi:DUF4347 domain-containing protein [Hydrogenophaga crassostreae]|nr:DUF4347 domain-containing protein [Hydrogenophaga crassostreae]AOW13043.1 hypothetical protein LPB072_09475 [Hydrogenophaga crassostreae]